MTLPAIRSHPLLYLTSYGLSLLGAGVGSVLMPLLVLERTGDVLAAGLLATVATGTSAVVGVLGGVLVDRVDRRIVSALSAAAAATSVAALPVVDALWGLDLAWFLVLAVVGATVRVPGMTAHETLLPALARLRGEPGERSRLDRLLGARETLSNVLLLAGPGLGGLLVALLGVSPTPFVVIAAANLLAGALTVSLDPRAGRVTVDRRLAGGAPLRRAGAELLVGWRFLGRRRIVLGATLVSASFVAIISALQSTLMPAWFSAQDLPALVGMTLAAFACGSLVGSAVFVATAGRVRRRTWFVVGMVGSPVGLAALATLASPAVVLAAVVLVGLTYAPAAAVLGVLTVEATPDVRRGRVLGAQNAILLGAPALTGAPLGAVAAWAGLGVAAVVVAGIAAVTALVALRSPVLRDLEPAPAVGPVTRA